VPRLFETRRLVQRELTAGTYEVRPLWAAQALALLPLHLSGFAVFFNLAYWLIGIPLGEAGANYWCVALKGIPTGVPTVVRAQAPVGMCQVLFSPPSLSLPLSLSLSL
jgi:hypothetical protein